MTLDELYRSYRADGEGVEYSLLKQIDWFTINAIFDPKTGGALPQALSKFLSKVSQHQEDGIIRDRLWRITDHARASVERIFRTLNENPRREQALLPIRSVRELDVNSFIKLSSRPGRNIREKLASKPYLQAVHRFQSVDLTENRLLKAFVSRLAELLELRRDCLQEKEDELLQRIQSWLFTDNAKAISRWENLPPNNTLLVHRDYRRIWDAWRWLQTLDEDIEQDLKNMKTRGETIKQWRKYGQLYSECNHLFADMPVLFDSEFDGVFDYGVYKIRPWEKIKCSKINKKIVRNTTEIMSEPFCVDFSASRPRYSTKQNVSKKLNETYIWQQWKNENSSEDIELFNSDALFLHTDTETVSVTDLLFSKDSKIEHLERAARAFASKLHETNKTDTLIWLVPDFVNYFDLRITSSNLNFRFSNAEPLPRSVAAVFAQVDHSKIKNNSFPVLVVDTIGNTICITKLIAHFDKKLLNRIPETFGYYWERCPPVVIKHRDPEETEINTYQIITVDDKGNWQNAHRPKEPKPVDLDMLKNDERIGQFELCITLNESPVVGGIRLHDFQKRAGGIPLWRDHIPELSIKVRDRENRDITYPLVSKKKKIIKPIRGQPVEISVPDTYFELPAKQHFYTFKLFYGEKDDEELGYSAKLESSEFPLEKVTKCHLKLTFTYGADDPYCLIFEPLNHEFPPVQAVWEKTKEEIITNAPAPPYPKPLSWKDLENWKNAQGEPEDLLKWLIKALTDLKDKIQNRSMNDMKFISYKRRSLPNRIPLIWQDNRSLNDEDVPQEFKKSFNELISFLSNHVPENSFIKKFFPLLSCLHKDNTDNNCIKWIMQQVDTDQILDVRAIGFSLGDLSESWQQHVLSKLKSNPSQQALRVFAYAIWQEQHFIENFSIVELRSILNTLKIMLSEIKPCPPKKNEKDKRTTREWKRATAEPLELLLGLLRTRELPDPEIKMLLQPHQEITKELVKQLGFVKEQVMKSAKSLPSRIQMDIQNIEGGKNFGLLSALNLYLIGDDGANIIRITGVSDNDNDD